MNKSISHYQDKTWPALSLGLLLCLLWTLPAVADKKAKKSTEWYLKTTVEVTDPETGRIIRDTRSGVLGQLAESEAGFDRHDVPAYASTTDSRAAIVFIQGEDWDEMAGEYLSNYHKNDSKKDSWVFTVHSSLSPETVTLHWDGLFELSQYEQNGVIRYTSTQTSDNVILKKLSLVDLQTGEVIQALAKNKDRKKYGAEFNSYTFSMNGETRRDFRWVLGKVRKSHFEPVYQPSSEPQAVAATQSKNKHTAQSNDALSSLQIRQLKAAADLPAQGKFGAPPKR